MAFKIESGHGKMKHTFTGIRPEFPNFLIHKIINEAVLPFRIELMRRAETAAETQLSDNLRTYMLDNLQYLRSKLQTYAFTAVYDPDVTLETRKTNRDAYVNTVLDKSNTAELETRKVNFTHSDELLGPADVTVHNVTFDYTGLVDKDMAQPTPDRIHNDIVRETVVGLDYMIVAMTRCHSADNTRTIMAQEAATFITDFVDLLYHNIDSHDPGVVPFHPTATSLNERDNLWNANGEFDPEVDMGGPVAQVDTDTRLSFEGNAGGST